MADKMPNRLPDTVTEAISLLRDLGYTADFELIDGQMCVGEMYCILDKVTVDRVFRFEGPSDPGDQMIVFAITDTDTGTRGTLASAYGIDADPDERDFLTGLATRFDRWANRQP